MVRPGVSRAKGGDWAECRQLRATKQASKQKVTWFGKVGWMDGSARVADVPGLAWCGHGPDSSEPDPAQARVFWGAGMGPSSNVNSEERKG